MIVVKKYLVLSILDRTAVVMSTFFANSFFFSTLSLLDSHDSLLSGKSVRGTLAPGDANGPSSYSFMPLKTIKRVANDI